MSRPTCPFALVAVTSMHSNRKAHAKSLAMAFATAHELSDVFASLRYEARRSGEANLATYLDGRCFGSRDQVEENFSDLRDAAHVYLESV